MHNNNNKNYTQHIKKMKKKKNPSETTAISVASTGKHKTQH